MLSSSVETCNELSVNENISASSSSVNENTISGHVATISVDMTYLLLRLMVSAGSLIVYSIGLLWIIDSSIVNVASMQGSTNDRENDVFMSVC